MKRLHASKSYTHESDDTNNNNMLHHHSLMSSKHHESVSTQTETSSFDLIEEEEEAEAANEEGKENGVEVEDDNNIVTTTENDETVSSSKKSHIAKLEQPKLSLEGMLMKNKKLCPFGKYLGSSGMKKFKKVKFLSLQQCLNVVHEVYEKKCIADAEDRRAGTVRTFLLTSYHY
jgi:hypothetical protein